MKKKTPVYDNDWPIVAICYDFDKTLSPKDMQEFGLIDKLGCSAEEFWAESGAMARERGMDKLLAYMRLILQKSGEDITVTKRDFSRLGEQVELYPGLESWFDRINAIGRENHLNIEHYIISAGLKEIIEGSPIASKLSGIYASSFLYNAYHKPTWPCQVVNYTTKTQYLFRVTKNCVDLGDEDSVNKYIEDSKRRIPFKNMIYIGDSETDIPAMKVVKNGGGVAIGVYNPKTFNMDNVRKLLLQERIDFFVPADYSEQSRLESLVATVLSKISAAAELSNLHRKQATYADRLDYIDDFVAYTKEYLDSEVIAESSVDDLRSQAKNILNRMRRNLTNEFGTMVSEEEIASFVNEKDSQIRQLMRSKKKALKAARLLAAADASVDSDEEKNDSENQGKN